MSDTDTISVSQLIELVRNRPVLWDRQKEVYKNRKLTRKAWVEICESLVENYDELSDQEQKAVGRSVISKWANLRDNWLRYWRKRQQLLLSGSSTSTLKKYIHHDQLLFLSKVYDPECQQEVEEIQVDVDVISDPDMEPSPAHSSGETSQNIWSFQEEEIDKPPGTDHHVFFFYSVLPLIKDFNNEQTIDFQMALFESIKRIRVKAVTNNQLHNNPSPHCHISYKNKVPDKMTMTSSGHFSNHTQEVAPQLTQESYHKDQFNGSCNLEKNSYKTTMEKNNLDMKPPLEAENNSKICHDLSNLNRTVSKLERISKRISVTSLGDSYDHFGRYIVSLLRRFSPKKIKLFKRKLIKFISNHLVRNSKKLHVFVSSQNISPSCKESQEIIRNDSNVSYHNDVNISEDNLKSTIDKSASERCDSYKVSTHNSSEEPASSSHISFSNHTYLVENLSPTTFSKLNQTPNKKRKKNSL